MKSLQEFPRIPLAVLPTPIQKLENISRLLGTNVWIKRDDLTGIGLGGNKVRKLEFLLADAKRQGAEIVFTTGGAQSNHAMLTAACAKKLGMTPILILKKRGVTERKGNQLLEYLMDTDVSLWTRTAMTTFTPRWIAWAKPVARKYYENPLRRLPTPSGGPGLCKLHEGNCRHRYAFRLRLLCRGQRRYHAGVALGAKLFMPKTQVVGSDGGQRSL